MTRQMSAGSCDEGDMRSRMITHGLGTAIGLVLLSTATLTGCGDDDDTAVADEAATTSTTAPDTESTTSTTQMSPTGPQPLPTEGPMPIKPDAGRYTLAAIGLSDASIELDDGWRLQIVGPHEVILTDAAGGPGRHEIAILRPDLLVRPGFVGPPFLPAVDPATDLMPLEDIDAWLADSQEWRAEGVEEVEVDGRPGLRFTLRPDFTVCEAEDSFGCNGVMAFVEGENPTDGAAFGAMDRGLHEVLWLRDVDGRPLALNIGVGERLEEQDEQWAERARAVVASLELG